MFRLISLILGACGGAVGLLLLFQRLYLTGKRRQFRTACQYI